MHVAINARETRMTVPMVWTLDQESTEIVDCSKITLFQSHTHIM
jgi:hypothetical protein